MTTSDAPFDWGDRLPTLDGERVRLRHPRPGDLDAVYAIFGDDETMRWWSHEAFQRREQAADYLRDIDRHFAERTLFQWAVTLPGADEPVGDELVGTVTLDAWSRRNRRMEVGYILHPAQWGKGIASDAVRTVLRFAFRRLDLHRVEAEVDPRNPASVRLLERLGFREEGRLAERWFVYNEWCDSLIFGLLRADFERAAAVREAGRAA